MSEASATRTSALKLCAGSLAGMSSMAVGHPLDIVKIRMQSASSGARSTSTLECLAAIHSQEGCAGMFRGVAPPVFAAAWVSGTMLTTHEHVYRALRARVSENASRLGACVAAGAAAALVITPFDSVKIQLQLQQGRQGGGALVCARSMVLKHGIGSLARGFSSCVAREVPSIAIWLYTYGVMKAASFGIFGDGVSPAANLVCQSLSGGVAGVMCTACCIPADVVKTVQQESTGRGRPLSLVAAAREVYARSGVGGFLRGVGPATARAFPVSVVYFVVYEELVRAWGISAAL